MHRSPHILIALLVLLPFASWLTTTGGLPACCGGKSCAMAAHCPMASNPMATGAMGQARCSMSAAPQLSLPASFFPVMPLPRRVHGVPSSFLAPAARNEAASVILPGYPPLLLRPPSA